MLETFLPKILSCSDQTQCLGGLRRIIFVTFFARKPASVREHPSASCFCLRQYKSNKFSDTVFGSLPFD